MNSSSPAFTSHHYHLKSHEHNLLSPFLSAFRAARHSTECPMWLCLQHSWVPLAHGSKHFHSHSTDHTNHMPRLNKSSGPTSLVLTFGISYQKFAVSQGDKNARQKQFLGWGVGRGGFCSFWLQKFPSVMVRKARQSWWWTENVTKSPNIMEDQKAARTCWNWGQL